MSKIIRFEKWITNIIIKGLVKILIRVHGSQTDKVPSEGPLIMVANHINFLDIPVMYFELLPRKVTAMAKIESWDNPFLAHLGKVWEGIPIRRGEVDLNAFQMGLKVLQEKKILAISPEGTRSGDGRLQKGHGGIAAIALRSNAPLLPVVFYGQEKFKENFRSFRRTEFFIVVGNPFYLKAGGIASKGEMAQQMADEIMYQLSALLPSEYRGVYADLSLATEKYLEFPDGSESNLRHVPSDFREDKRNQKNTPEYSSPG